MDYRIVKKEAFTVIGKGIRVTTRNGENLRRIPQFWQECNADGTAEQLHALSPGRNLLGICMDIEPDQEQFTYLIAVQADSAGGGRSDTGKVEYNDQGCPSRMEQILSRVFLSG